MATTRTDRLDIAARALAGIPGGYTLAALLSVAAARWLPLPRADAVAAGMMLGLVAWPPVMMTAFALHSLPRLCACLTLTTAILATLAYWPA